MLDEVLGEDGLDVGELQPHGDVGHHVDARQRLAVDVDPTLQALTAAADVQAGMGFPDELQDHGGEGTRETPGDRRRSLARAMPGGGGV